VDPASLLREVVAYGGWGEDEKKSKVKKRRKEIKHRPSAIRSKQIKSASVSLDR
jgi:hypothetical protein